MFKRVLTFTLVYFIVSATYSQKCFDYHKSNCFPKPSKFVYKENVASVSFLFKSGEIRDIPFTLLLGIDYRITLCADSVFNDVIKFVIINEEGKQIYNNSAQNFNLNLEFSSRKTHNVIFEIEAPELSIINADSTLNEGCIGILIEEMVSVKTGF